MSYPHYLIEIPMDGHQVSAAAPTAGTVIPYPRQISLTATYNVTTIGGGQFAPLCVPHRIHRVGVRADVNMTSPQDLIFWKRLEGGATTWGSTQAPEPQPTGEYFRFMLPTLMATGKAVFKSVTGKYIVYPGEVLCAGVSTAIAGTARISLLCSPVWENPANVTSMYQTTAP